MSETQTQFDGETFRLCIHRLIKEATSMITTNQQFLPTTICSAVLLAAGSLSTSTSVIHYTAITFHLCAILLSFALYMLSNAMFEVAEGDFNPVRLQYNDLALVTAFVSSIGMILHGVSVLPSFYLIPVAIVSAYIFYLYIVFQEHRAPAIRDEKMQVTQRYLTRVAAQQLVNLYNSDASSSDE